VAAFLHWLCHVTGCDYGLSYGHFGWYNLWSGFAGGVRVFEWGALGGLVYYHHTCHDSPGCLRWGRYPAAGGLFRLCARHHPDLQGKHPRRELIHRLHREHQEQARH
jgi:hypothetical protein